MNAGRGGEVASARETSGGEEGSEPTGMRALALAAVALGALVLAALPAAIALRLVPVDGRELGAALGGAALVIGALKGLALAWAMVARVRPDHPVRLVNLDLN